MDTFDDLLMSLKSLKMKQSGNESCELLTTHADTQAITCHKGSLVDRGHKPKVWEPLLKMTAGLGSTLKRTFSAKLVM